MTQEKTAYLAGSMEFSDDAGLEWRLEARKILAPLGIKCIIPNEEEADIIGSIEDYQKAKSEDLPEYLRMTRAYMQRDLDYTENSTYFVCRYEGERIHGTTGEAQFRWQLGMDAYLITGLAVEDIPGWFLASFTHKFSSVQQLADWLEKQDD